MSQKGMKDIHVYNVHVHVHVACHHYHILTNSISTLNTPDGQCHRSGQRIVSHCDYHISHHLSLSKCIGGLTETQGNSWRGISHS